MSTTPVERLTRIETLLHELKLSQTEGHAALAAEVKAIRSELSADKAELAAIKNKGIGLLVGLGLVAAALGAKISAFISAAIAAVK